MYRLLFELVLSRLDPETAHHLAMVVIRVLGRMPGLVRPLTRPEPSLAVDALGLRFESPFGVAAGFDKDGVGVRGLWALGFGHVEVGTVTARPQPGNDAPRLFRLKRDRALINRMGFNNSGAADAAGRLARIQKRRGRPIVGANIGKSRVVDVDDAIPDYLASTASLAPVADYLAVNVSSPNTPGLRGLQELDRLAPLLTAVLGAAGEKPVLVKIAPDLTDEQVERIARLAVELGLAGIIATNTTLSRAGLRSPRRLVEEAGAGGLSGPPVARRSLEVLRIIRAAVPADYCIISVGGVETAAQVAERLAAGATLVQGYTGFLYRGPFWARSINRGLARMSSTSQRVG
jgi:dihydroorotate dehydrogenase